MDQDSAQTQDSSSENSSQETFRNDPVRDLLTWESPSRPPINLNREILATGVSICLLLSVIVSFFQEWMLIILIWGAFFFINALAKMPAENVTHKITTQGITSMGHVYLWEDLGPFWFTKRNGTHLLHIVQRGNFFGTILIVIPEDLSQEKVRDAVAKYLSFVEMPEKSRTEKMTDWLTAKLSQAPKMATPKV